MHLEDYLERNLVFVIDESKDKLSFLETLAARVGSQIPGIDVVSLLSKLEEREAEISTGIGNGVAIPHTTVEGLVEPTCIIAKIPGGVDFESLDGSPVYISFLLLSPPQSTGIHLRLLARIARLVMNADFISSIIDAADAEEIYKITVEEDLRHV
jgi:PTS system nitrogen regulatory IIA component